MVFLVGALCVGCLAAALTMSGAAAPPRALRWRRAARARVRLACGLGSGSASRAFEKCC